MAQVVECLPSKCKALISNPGTAKRETQLSASGYAYNPSCPGVRVQEDHSSKPALANCL
jgi:hypothetical protein